MIASKRYALVLFLITSFFTVLTAYAQEKDSAGNSRSAEQAVTVGGGFSFGIAPSWFWSWLTPPAGFAKLLSPDTAEFDVDLNASLEIDASLTEMGRVYGRVSLFYPLDEAAAAYGITGEVRVPSLKVESVYGQFTPLPWFSVRAGKAAYAWFPGYFFSPADRINNSYIDPLSTDSGMEYDAETRNKPQPASPMDYRREGPVSIGFSADVSGTDVSVTETSVLSFSLVADLDDVAKLEDIRYAGRAGAELGPFTLGLGAYYAYQEKPSAFLTLSADIPFVTLFAESVFYFGTDKTFIIPASSSSAWPSDVDAASAPAFFYNQSTAGFSAAYEPWGLSGHFQYFFNGLGYPFSSSGLLLSSGVDALITQGRLTEEDLLFPARHYTAVDAAWTIHKTPLTFEVIWVMNYTDMSGVVKADVSVDPWDFLSLGASVPFFYGPLGGEYSPLGTGMGLSFFAELSLNS